MPSFLWALGAGASAGPFFILNSTSGIHKCNLISQVAYTPYNARAEVLVLK